MQELLTLGIVVISILLLYKILKPYFIKYDSTLLFTGGLGSGKTLNSVKTAVSLYRRSLLEWRFKCFKVRLLSFLSKLPPFKKHLQAPSLPEKPLLISNVPILLNRKKNIYSCALTAEILTLKERIPEHSIVVIDEMPLLVNQFNWNQEEVKNNLNEFIALFRHYVGGYLIVNGQSESEIVKQVRAKLNSGFWCFHFQKFLCFYRYKVVHFMISENQTASSTDFLDEHIKFTYGILPLHKQYDSRYMSVRYNRVKNAYKPTQFTQLKKETLLSLNKDKSCLDTEEKND